MKTIMKSILPAMFLLTGIMAFAQNNTTITQKNDTLIIETDNGTKVTIVTSDVDKIMDFIETNIDEFAESADSINKVISVEVVTDEENFDTIKSTRQTRIITIVNDSTDTDYEYNCEHSCSKPKLFEPYFMVEWGMNNYMNNGVFPDATGEQYSVKPWGSWSCAIGPGIRINAGENISLNFSADVLWYNFKFQDKTTRFEETPVGVIFGNDEGVQYPLRSKLTVTYLNLQFMPMVHFGKDTDHFNKKMFRIGAGAYAGYRIDSYAKYVDQDNGVKNKLHYRDNYYLENFRYGVKVLLGVDDFNIFANYDLNNLFSPGKGPKLNAFSIGLNFTI